MSDEIIGVIVPNGDSMLFGDVDENADPACSLIQIECEALMVRELEDGTAYVEAVGYNATEEELVAFERLFDYLTSREEPFVMSITLDSEGKSRANFMLFDGDPLGDALLARESQAEALAGQLLANVPV